MLTRASLNGRKKPPKSQAVGYGSPIGRPSAVLILYTCPAKGFGEAVEPLKRPRLKYLAGRVLEKWSGKAKKVKDFSGNILPLCYIPAPLMINGWS
jgi:hypothetical protein